MATKAPVPVIKAYPLAVLHAHDWSNVMYLPASSTPVFNRLSALRACTERLAHCGDSHDYIDELLTAIADNFPIQHIRLLLPDDAQHHLFTADSYGQSSYDNNLTVTIGEGVIGRAAEQRSLLHAVRTENSSSEDRSSESGRTISQLIVPVTYHEKLIALLILESPEAMDFTGEDEDAIIMLAHYLAATLPPPDQQITSQRPTADSRQGSKPALLRHYTTDDSIFIDEEYLIKGVAGAILWKLANEHLLNHRSEFCNRELRLDPSLHLPAVVENLEARLILLKRRLDARCPYIAIEKTGRGRFHFRVDRPLQLSER